MEISRILHQHNRCSGLNDNGHSKRSFSSCSRLSYDTQMNNEYWLDRWERADIGFHQNDINPYLREYWQALALDSDCQVLVPMCGKSRDMLWLREQGHQVLGVELSLVAVQTFFSENNLTPKCIDEYPFSRWEANGMHIMCGNFFDLREKDLANVSAVYDRASLVALPPEMRKHYAHHLVDILPPATQILLITLDYPPDEMPGPPFPVAMNEMHLLYASHMKIKLLAQHDVLAQNPRFQQRGLSRLQERVFLLESNKK